MVGCKSWFGERGIWPGEGAQLGVNPSGFVEDFVVQYVKCATSWISMFLRKRHLRYVLLHTYRDGRGRVRQRRLGHFEDRAALARQLEPERWSCWVKAFAQDYPEVKVDWERLLLQARRFLASSECNDKQNVQAKRRTSKDTRADQIQRLIRTLGGLLDQENDPEVLQRVAPSLQQLLSKSTPPDDELGELRQRFYQERANLPSRRCFDPADPQVVPYLAALQLLLQALDSQGQWDECARLLAEQVRRCPSAQGYADYGAVLQLLGRSDEAMQQYQCIPGREAARHYNMVSCCFQTGAVEEALEHLLRALNRDRSVADALKRIEKGHPPDPYWDRYGRLWSHKAKSFVQQVYRQFPVRRRLRQVGERGVQARSLLSARARGYVLSKLDEPPIGLQFEP